jgi:uncharacterized protein (TIGR03382 family)
MKTPLLSVLLAFVLLSTATPAWAGGIVIVGRDPETTRMTTESESNDTDQDTEATTSPGNPSVVGTYGFGPAVFRDSTLPKTKSPVNPPFEPVIDSQVLAMADEDLEYADVGCGGAQAASGPLGALPLAIAGLALLFRRRR